MPPLLLVLVFASALLYSSNRGVASQPPEGGCLHVNTTTHRVIDASGRERYFHGVNVVVKGPPWLPRMDSFDPEMSFVERDMMELSDIGLNGIRLGVMWPGAEPQRGIYNETYFASVADLINASGKYGIYTLLDMHQDVLSDKYCGEGVPDWAADSGNARGFPFPVDQPYGVDPHTGYPTPKDCAKHSWSEYQVTEAASAAYQNIYNNSNGLLDNLAAFWGKVAQEFVGNPYVLGYEIINEPWAGDIFADVELLLPKIADRKNLAGVYNVVNQEIRKHDQCHNVFFESVTWDETEVGFEEVPGGEQYANRSVLSYHFYKPPQINPEVSLFERQLDQTRLKCAGFLTEFQIGSTSQSTINTMDVADLFLQSWLGWSYKPYVVKTGESGSIWLSNGALNMPVVSVLSRSYATAVAGVVAQMKYSQETKDFSLLYHTTSACKSTSTEIYFNQALHYGNGYTVTVTPSDKASWSVVSKNLIVVTHSQSVPEGTGIMVTVAPK